MSRPTKMWVLVPIEVLIHVDEPDTCVAMIKYPSAEDVKEAYKMGWQAPDRETPEKGWF